MRELDLERTQTLPVLDADGFGLAEEDEHGSAAERTIADLRQKLQATEALCARYLELLQSREWKRGVTDERLHELEEQADTATRRAQALEGERAALNAALASLRQECEALRAAPPPDPAATGETGAMRAAASAREAEIDAERSARLAAERAARAAEIRGAQQEARIAELETFGIGLGRALQLQTEAAHRAGNTAEEAARAAGELRTNLSRLEAGVREDAVRAAAERDAAEGRLRELMLELERTRGALGERDLQIRRLERNLARRYAASAEAPALSALAPVSRAASLIPLGGATPFAVQGGARTRIGRAADNEVCLEDSSVSRHHAVIVCTPGGTFIEDLDSVNGVGVNGRRVRSARLAEGDILTLGMLRLRFSFAQQSAAGA